jgi:hypothetical protein
MVAPNTKTDFFSFACAHMEALEDQKKLHNFISIKADHDTIITIKNSKPCQHKQKVSMAKQAKKCIGIKSKHVKF